jgi:hypothetical protein
MLVLRQHLSTVMTVPHAQKRQAPKSARPRATRWRDDRNRGGAQSVDLMSGCGQNRFA